MTMTMTRTKTRLTIVVVLVCVTGAVGTVATTAADAQVDTNVTIGDDEPETTEIYDRLGPVSINTVEQTDDGIAVELTNTGDSVETVGIVQVPENSGTILWENIRLLPGENIELGVDTPGDTSNSRPIAYLDTRDAEMPFTALVPPSSSDTLPIYQGVGAGMIMAFGATVLAARRRLRETGSPDIDMGES